MYKNLDLDKIKAKSYTQADLAGKKVIIRAALNAAQDKEGNITEITRVKEAAKLIKEIKNNAKQLIIIGHLGRPENRDAKFSLKPIQEILQAEIGESIFLLDDFNQLPQDFETHKIVLLENIRFYADEQSDSAETRMQFANKLSALGEIFINDAFPDYRIAASTYELAKTLPSYIGPAFLKEVEGLSKLSDPAKPFIVVMGGAKLSEKVDLMKILAGRADKIIVGGALAYTLLKAQGVEIGKSLVEEDKVTVGKEILDQFTDKIVLPVDHLIADKFEKPVSQEQLTTTTDNSIPAEKLGVDIGTKTAILYKQLISTARTILWNGPMGVFEWDLSSAGTKEIMQAISDNDPAYTVTGGGDSLAAIAKFNVTNFDHISTAGGAMLSFIGDDDFPVLDVILGE